MNPIGLCLLSLVSLSLASTERAPHGLVYENPQAFSPSAYEFFHPNEGKHDETKDPSCAASKCSPTTMPLAAQVVASEIYESKLSTPQVGRKQLGAGGIAAIVFGVAFLVILAMGVYHVTLTRRANISKAKPNAALQP